MDENNFSNFVAELRNACLIGAETDEQHASFEANFTQELLSHLVDFGVVEDYIPSYFRKKGMKVNGYYIPEERDRLFLFTSIPFSEKKDDDLLSISKSDLDESFARCLNFYDACSNRKSLDIDESTDAWEMINDIQSLDNKLLEIRLYVLVGGKTRQSEYPSRIANDVLITHHVWTIDRLMRLIESGKPRESIDVDFLSIFGKALPCLEAPQMLNDFRTFLVVLNGNMLADIYNEHREQILQKNVRCFLQLKGKVNQGLQKTIHDSPAFFMAYNNGITMTAEDVVLNEQNGSLFLEKIKDVQIVNGGQTTASIWSAKYKDKVDVSKVGVQVKLTSMSHNKKMDQLVTDISRYANTQNKVTESDFSSNHPFHRKIEELSRTTWAPAVGDSQVETKWFYERSRGQYMGERSRYGTPKSAGVKKWEIQHPSHQLFSKTDLAKFENTWHQKPYVVSLGAQKNFVEFMNSLKKTNCGEPDDSYFRRLIAKAILFKAAEKIVGKQKFGGYRAQIVTYTLAKLSYQSSQLIDLDIIWMNQEISEIFSKAIETVCFYANDLIQNEKPMTVTNPSEWAKREKCWDMFKNKEIILDEDFILSLSTTKKKITVQPIIDQVVTYEDQVQINWLKESKEDMWGQLYEWSKNTDNFPGRTRNMFASMKYGCQKKEWNPTSKQAKFANDLYNQALALGFKYEK